MPSVERWLGLAFVLLVVISIFAGVYYYVVYVQPNQLRPRNGGG